MLLCRGDGASGTSEGGSGNKVDSIWDVAHSGQYETQRACVCFSLSSYGFVLLFPEEKLLGAAGKSRLGIKQRAMSIKNADCCWQRHSSQKWKKDISSVVERLTEIIDSDNEEELCRFLSTEKVFRSRQGAGEVFISCVFLRCAPCTTLFYLIV